MSTINFSGLASGIDTESLISAVSSATRTQKVEPLENKITELEDTDTALETLRTKLNDLKTMLYDFSTIAGGGVVKTASSTNEAYVSASAQNSATNGTYSVNVTQLARNGTYVYGHSFSSSSDKVALSASGHSSGTVTVEVGSGSDKKTISVDVTVDSTTISGFVAEFNEAAAANGNCAQASLLNVGTSASPDYRVMLSSTTTGTSEGTITITSSCGYLDTSLPGSVETVAQDAIFDFNGVTGITRESNSISDVVAGLTLQLNGEGSANITVADDANMTAVKIQEWIDKYNEIVEFMDENNEITRDESGDEVENIWGALASTSTDDTALSTIRNVFASIKSEISGTGVNILADLGITTERDGTLAFDKDEFETAMSTSSASVNSILTQLADTMATTGGAIDVITRYNGSFDITVNSNQSTIDDLTTRISEIEDAITDQETSLRARYARLESLISEMQSGQQALQSALAGLG